jgi:hypothetical protein
VTNDLNPTEWITTEEAAALEIEWFGLWSAHIKRRPGISGAMLT